MNIKTSRTAPLIAFALTLIAAILVIVVKGEPADAASVSSKKVVTCETARKTAYDIDEFDHFDKHYENHYEATLVYKYCSGDGVSYHVLDRYLLSMTQYGSASCNFGDWTAYIINVHELGPTNPPTKEWACVNGKNSYTHTHDLNAQVLPSSATDRCFRFNWKARWTAHNDKEGLSNERCLGGAS